MRNTVLLAAALLSVACSRSDKTTTEEPTGETTISAVTIVARPTDEELIRRVEAAIAGNPRLSTVGRNVEIDAVDGFVTLRGSADSQLSKETLEQVVADVPGVKTTLNKLDVRSVTNAEADENIAFSIQRALVTDPVLAPEADNVTIEVKNGVVTLRGPVTSPDARTAIERVIEQKPGVVAVDNELGGR